ncbi:NosD domain-containing protein [Halonotius pteroides]|nr:NosD domain-containing protein [Halonotius pteroides]
MDWRLPRRWQVGLMLFVLVVVIPAALFGIPVDSAAPEPVPFEDTRAIGVASAEEVAADDTAAIPRVQVFYSQYQYVIGYYGLPTALAAITEPATRQQYGHPLVTYVTDYSSTTPSVGDDGRIDTERYPAWTAASDAVFVVDSGATTPVGEAIVPFSDRDDATAFADDTGGRVVSWTTLSEQSFEADDGAVVRDRVSEQRADADAWVANRTELLDRERSVIVGSDDDLQTAIDDAPNGTTVAVAPGQYPGSIEIDHPITLRGPGATIAGDGEGSVISVTADRVAIQGVTVTGVGNQTRNPDAVAGDTWDANIELGYGHGDAAIKATGANDTLIADVTVPHTPANGVLLRRSPGGVVTNLSVAGPEDWHDGFMGVIAMYSPTVIEDSAVTDGRDGVYLHRSDGTVIRNNTFRENRYGVHLMYSSETLVANNRMAGQEYGGITVMTDPTRTAIVGNLVRNTATGISTSGSNAYIAHNGVTDSRIGITTTAINSLYEHNVVRHNNQGMRTGSVVATSKVTGNDFIANDRHAGASAGPLRVWRGNHWEDALATPSGRTAERAYMPTDPVDGQRHRSMARRTVAASPVYQGLRELTGASPGLRSGSILDPDPVEASQNQDLVETTETLHTDGLAGVPATPSPPDR